MVLGISSFFYALLLRGLIDGAVAHDSSKMIAQKNAKHNIHKQDLHTDSSSIDRIAYDMLYLASIGINISTKSKPDEKCLEHYRTNEEDMKALFCMSARHFIDALVGTNLKQAGAALPKYWEDRMVKAVRKVLLFDVERKKLCAWMDSEHIWYLPLKGIILKDYYPSIGMRQLRKWRYSH